MSKRDQIVDGEADMDTEAGWECGSGPIAFGGWKNLAVVRGVDSPVGSGSTVHDPHTSMDQFQQCHESEKW
jgi:hypothetical protein